MHLLGRSDGALRLADAALARQPDLPRALALKASLVPGTDPQTARAYAEGGGCHQIDRPTIAIGREKDALGW